MLLTTTSKINAIKEYMKSGDYDAAVRIAEKVNPEKITSVRDLMTLSNAFLKKRRYEDAKSIYVEMHNHAQTHKVLVGLIELCLKTNSPEEAEVYIREFRKLEPENPERLIYRYRVDAMLGKGPEYLVKSLKKLKDEDYTDVWGLELAKAYYKMGDYEKSAQECKDILLWFAGTDSAAKAHILLGACAEKGVSVTLPEARPRREEHYYDDDEPSDVPVIAASVKEPAPQPEAVEDAPFNLSAALREAVSETIDEDRRAAEEAAENEAAVEPAVTNDETADTYAADTEETAEPAEEDIEAVEDIRLPGTGDEAAEEVADEAEEAADGAIEDATEETDETVSVGETVAEETAAEEVVTDETVPDEAADEAADESDDGFFDEEASNEADEETSEEIDEEAVVDIKFADEAEEVSAEPEEISTEAETLAEEAENETADVAEPANETTAADFFFEEPKEAADEPTESTDETATPDIPEDATTPINLPEDFGADDLVTVAVMKAKMQDDDDDDIVLHDFFPEEKHVSRSSWDNQDAVPTLVTLPSSYSTADSKPAAPKTDDFFFDEDSFNSAANPVEESDIETEALEQDYEETPEEASADEPETLDEEELEEEELEEDDLAAENAAESDNTDAVSEAPVAFATDADVDTEEDKEAFLKSLSASVEKSLSENPEENKQMAFFTDSEEDGQLSFFTEKEPESTEEAPIPEVKTDDDFLDISANIAAAVADEMENGTPEVDEVSKEPTKVHADLTAQALDAMLREDDEAIERALRGMLSDR
ncbi:MAG: hypothetical protein K6F11_06020 [Lachnospiraceae bacterium]|nr:hypothetical protein [Lachnospiraceae bacterium]